MNVNCLNPRTWLQHSQERLSIVMPTYIDQRLLRAQCWAALACHGQECSARTWYAARHLRCSAPAPPLPICARVRARPQNHATLTFARLCRHLGSSEGLPQQRFRLPDIADLAAKAARAERSSDGLGAACTQLLQALRSMSRAQAKESCRADKAAHRTCACSARSNCSATSRLSSMHKRSATQSAAVTVAGCVAPHT
jgi:hypothetical protein